MPFQMIMSWGCIVMPGFSPNDGMNSMSVWSSATSQFMAWFSSIRCLCEITKK